MDGREEDDEFFTEGSNGVFVGSSFFGFVSFFLGGGVDRDDVGAGGGVGAGVGNCIGESGGGCVGAGGVGCVGEGGAGCVVAGGGCAAGAGGGGCAGT